MTPTRRTTIRTAAILTLTLAVATASGCAATNYQPGRSPYSAAAGASGQSPLATRAFSTLLLDTPNPGPTGPAVSDTTAAGGAPLTGDTALIPPEQQCVQDRANPGWNPTLVPSEHGDSARTHLFACAHYTGGVSEDNQVYAYQAPAKLAGSLYDAVTGGPGDLYVYGGGDGSRMKEGFNAGPFVADLDARTLAVKWKTVLDNVNASGQWNVLSGVNFTADGNLFVGYGHRLAKIDPATGQILADIDLPTGPARPDSLNFETIIAAPDGTIITKSQTRPLTLAADPASPTCTQQGFNAMIACKGVQPDTEVVAVNPKTMNVLDSLTLPQQVGGRNALTVHNGHIYTYLTAAKTLLRIEWKPRTRQLVYDSSWRPPYLSPGQTAGSAPCVMGDWVIAQTNGLPATAPLSLVAVNQDNPHDAHRIAPIPLGTSPASWIPAMQSCDTDTNTIYTADFGPGQAAAVKLHPGTGTMTTTWGPVPQRTLGFTTLIGPKDQRVLVGTNIKVTKSDQLKNSTYTEQLVWRNATTGAVLARSDYFAPMTAGTLPTPGYGGLVYDLQQDGGIVATQTLPPGKVPAVAQNPGG